MVQMESESPLLARVALPRVFSMPKELEINLHHRVKYSALKSSTHFQVVRTGA